MSTNIFQGSKSITDVVAKTLGYEANSEHNWFTEDIYFQSYFYLTKRFGFPEIHDEDYKKITVFDFKVKDYTIRIELNSSWVTFMMFGEVKKFKNSSYPIYWVKYNREARKKHNLIVSAHGENRSESETAKLLELIYAFEEENNIPHDIPEKEFNEKYGRDFWFKYLQEYNNRVLGIGSYKDYEKYGEEYMNSNKRHALKTLRQFLQNMISPIWIRDVPFNIKGNLTDEEARNFARFHDNIEIKFKTKTI